MKKGVTADEMIEAGKKVRAAGMILSMTVDFRSGRQEAVERACTGQCESDFCNQAGICRLSDADD